MEPNSKSVECSTRARQCLPAATDERRVHSERIGGYLQSRGCDITHSLVLTGADITSAPGWSSVVTGWKARAATRSRNLEPSSTVKRHRASTHISGSKHPVRGTVAANAAIPHRNAGGRSSAQQSRHLATDSLDDSNMRLSVRTSCQIPPR